MTDYIFKETQKFRQWWLYAILAFAFGEVLVISLWAEKSTGETNARWGILIGGGAIVLVAALLFFTRMNTRIDVNGIRVMYKPFVWGEKQWTWGEVQKAYVRQYSPLWEYGGWGVRYTINNGKAYNVRGDFGLQLELTNGKKILLGTQQPDELKRVLQNIKTNTPIQAIELNHE